MIGPLWFPKHENKINDRKFGRIFTFFRGASLALVVF